LPWNNDVKRCPARAGQFDSSHGGKCLAANDFDASSPGIVSLLLPSVKRPETQVEINSGVRNAEFGIDAKTDWVAPVPHSCHSIPYF